MNKYKSLKYNALMSSINTGVTLLFPLVTLPYVSRVLSVENIGKYNFSNTFISYFALLATLGVNTYGVRECSKVRDNYEEASSVVSQIFTINIITTLFSYVVLATLLISVGSISAYKTCIVVFSTTIFFTTFGVEWVYKAYERFTFITIRTVVFKIVSLILIFIFIRDEDDYVVYAMITAFGTCAPYLINFIQSRKLCSIRLTRKMELKIHLKPLLVLSASALAVHAYNSADTIMLGLLSNDYAVGLYTTASKIYLMAKSVLLSVLTVTVPRLTSLVNNREQFQSLIKKIVNVMNFIALPSMSGIILMSDEILFVIAGEEYVGASIPLKILGIAIIFSMYAWISSECILVPNEKEKDSLISTSIAALLNIALNIFLIPIWSATAAAITTVVAEACVMIYCSVKAKKLIKVRFINNNTVKEAIGCLGIGIVCYACKLLIPIIILRLFSAIIISAALYMLINILFENDVYLSLVKRRSL